MHRYYEIPYCSDSTAIFSIFAEDNGAIFLDSGIEGKRQGRYDIICSQPHYQIQGDNYRCIVTDKNGHTSEHNTSLLNLLNQYIDHSPDEKTETFSTGLIGYLTYDYGQQIILPELTIDTQYPLAQFNYYPWSIIVDHQTKNSFLCVDTALVSTEQKQAIMSRLSLRVANPRGNKSSASSITAMMDADQYQESFEQIQQYLLEGDCYQVNLANQFTAKTDEKGWDIYRRLRQVSSAPYAAYMLFDELEILSASPELFIQLDGDIVTSKPIKGTVPRGDTLEKDNQLVAQLKSSEKDQAENVMIVDLLRNDISKVCQNGSVQVPNLFNVESFSNVHHLVSTVTGQLNTDETIFSLLDACMPGGSITGAPKKRAMEIIHSLEKRSRGVYCGTIGYMSNSGHSQMNIAIRSLTKQHETIRYWAGGGIVADSQREDEYHELKNKASDIYKTLTR